MKDELTGVQIISIHALVKRATLLFHIVPVYFLISIHALVKRATPIEASASFVLSDFNPRPREEGDVLVTAQSYFMDIFQSTPS